MTRKDPTISGGAKECYSRFQPNKNSASLVKPQVPVFRPLDEIDQLVLQDVARRAVAYHHAETAAHLRQAAAITASARICRRRQPYAPHSQPTEAVP